MYIIGVSNGEKLKKKMEGNYMEYYRFHRLSDIYEIITAIGGL